jgi:hypothetical protein
MTDRSKIRQEVHRVVAGHRERHGYQPGMVWSPAAWRPGQECGCKPPSGSTWRGEGGGPCGWYVFPDGRRG